jgi:hypothetical protein
MEACEIWSGARNHKGYGYTKSGKMAHRVAYERVFGPIEEGLTLDHLCREKACVNPDHLEPVSPQENIKRGQRGPARLQRSPGGPVIAFVNGVQWVRLDISGS